MEGCVAARVRFWKRFPVVILHAGDDPAIQMARFFLRERRMRDEEIVELILAVLHDRHMVRTASDYFRARDAVDLTRHLEGRDGWATEDDSDG
jgi:hypothetical protein